MLLLYPLLASLLAAVVCGAMGPLTLLRRNTYAAGAISHTCLAGLGLAQYLQVACGLAWISPMTGALAAAVLAALYLAGRRAPPLQGGVSCAAEKGPVDMDSWTRRRDGLKKREENITRPARLRKRRNGERAFYFFSRLNMLLTESDVIPDPQK